MPSPDYAYQLLRAELFAAVYQGLDALQANHENGGLSAPESGMLSSDLSIQIAAAQAAGVPASGTRADILTAFYEQSLQTAFQQAEAINLDWTNPEERTAFLNEFRTRFLAQAFPLMDSSAFLSGADYYQQGLRDDFENSARDVSEFSMGYALNNFAPQQGHLEDAYLMSDILMRLDFILDNHGIADSYNAIAHVERAAGSPERHNGVVDDGAEFDAILDCARQLVSDGITDRTDDMATAIAQIYHLNPDQTERLNDTLDNGPERL